MEYKLTGTNTESISRSYGGTSGFARITHFQIINCLTALNTTLPRFCVCNPRKPASYLTSVTMMMMIYVSTCSSTRGGLHLLLMLSMHNAETAVLNICRLADYKTIEHITIVLNYRVFQMHSADLENFGISTFQASNQTRKLSTTKSHWLRVNTDLCQRHENKHWPTAYSQGEGGITLTSWCVTAAENIGVPTKS
ncbi:hypothetical protein CBL_12537 [Carabus blaptoides fortunei]